MAVAMSVNYYTVNGMILAEDRGGVYSEFVPDTLGSCVAVKDASETITYTADYWPYGEVRTSTGSKASPWGFVGLMGYLTDLAKRLYVRARHYRPNVGQWQTIDPLWPEEMAYGYASLAPRDHADMSGSDPTFSGVFPVICLWQGGLYRRTGLDDPWSNALCKAACFQIADGNKDHSLGPIEMRAYRSCETTCERLAAKGTKRMWCKGIEATIDHLMRHPKEGYKSINNKKLLENLLALWNEMGCPGSPPEID